MKVLITGTAIILLNILFLTYQQDIDRYIRAETMLKAITEECAAGAALYSEKTTEHFEGKIIGNPSEMMKYVEYILKNSFNLDNNLQPISESYIKNVNYYLYIFDDIQTHRTIKNGTTIETKPLNFPYTFTDTTGYTTQITEPSVIVTIEIDTTDFFRLPFITKTKVIRSALYELDDW